MTNKDGHDSHASVDSHGSRMAKMRLRAIIGAHTSDASAAVSSESSESFGVHAKTEPSEFGVAVGLVVDDVAWVLTTNRHVRSLGPALMWALRNKAKVLKLFSTEGAGDLARIAMHFDFAIEVFEVDVAGAARVATPKIVEKIEVSVADEMFAEFIRSAGADVVREHGVISGEVCGLEVCRVVRTVGTSALEIGVGAHDRETFKLLHGQTATAESLRKVVAEVAARRVAGAQVHPLNQLARERMLRHLVCRSPQLVGAKNLQAAQPPIARTNLKDVVPCCAVGEAETGEKIVVVFSVGVDPDVVSYGADARGQLNSSAELIFVMPTRDIVPAVERVAQMLRRPARFIGLDAIA
ncbi:MAG: hypothetical protein EB035_06095 [Actinobacteria bacterium]|nr:hypothetical protein [Actinomycetota bacterium]